MKHSEIICGHRWCFLPPERKRGWSGSRGCSSHPPGSGLWGRCTSSALTLWVYPLKMPNTQWVYHTSSSLATFELWFFFPPVHASAESSVQGPTSQPPLLEVAAIWRTAVQTQAHFFGPPFHVPVSAPHEPMNPFPYHLDGFSSSQKKDWFKTSYSMFARSRALACVFVLYLMTLFFRFQAACRFLKKIVIEFQTACQTNF